MSLHYWLLSTEALQVRAAREMVLRGAVFARSSRARVEEPQLPLHVQDGVATIRVEGVLTPTPDPQAEWYGEANTTYPDLQASLAAALADSEVREIVWSIDSPGGAVDGLFALLDDIEQARTSGKKMRALASSAHSAAYGIAAAVGHITATDRLASFGSVGVTTSAFVLGEMIGKTIHMTNTDAPEKRPAVETVEGKQVVVRYLDELAAEFMGSIARGRGVATADVAGTYGRGSSMLAASAKSAGMIDAIDRRSGQGYRPAGMASATFEKPEPATAAPAPTEPAGDPPAEETPAEAEPSEAPPAEPAGDPPTDALSAAERAELTAFRAASAVASAAERKSLIGALVAVGAETPATAFANGEPCARLATEALESLRGRVAALKAAKGNAAPAAPPTGPTAELSAIDKRTAATTLKKHGQAAHDRFVQARLARIAQLNGN